MWASREMLVNNNDQQLYVKTTIRELITYSIFMVIICYATFVQYSPTHYTYASMMKSLFSRQEDVTNMQLFWRVIISLSTTRSVLFILCSFAVC